MYFLVGALCYRREDTIVLIFYDMVFLENILVLLFEEEIRSETSRS
jgi:hypothetical protein